MEDWANEYNGSFSTPLYQKPLNAVSLRFTFLVPL
jgi:hypothetical protein